MSNFQSATVQENVKLRFDDSFCDDVGANIHKPEVALECVLQLVNNVLSKLLLPFWSPEIEERKK